MDLKPPPPVCVLLDFRETFVRSALIAACPTPASTEATAPTMAWPSPAPVHGVSLGSPATTPLVSHPALVSPALMGARVSVSLMEPSAAFVPKG